MKTSVFAGVRSTASSVVCIGIFDGVHIGHRKIIRETVRRAKALGVMSVGITFNPHPSRILTGHANIPMLCPVERRVDLMREAGLDRCVVLPFTRRLAGVSAENFVLELLVGRLHVRAVCTGSDFRFGRGAEGDVGFLRRAGRSSGFVAVSLAPVKVNGEVVSSTLIRKRVAEGDLKQVARLLGRPFSVDGSVVRGDGRGRRIGYPTVNLRVEQETLPPQGVYSVIAECDGLRYAGALHLGPRPTFGQQELRLEAHLIDTKRSFYGRKMRLYFVDRIRPISKFRTINDLVAQIQSDVAQVRKSVRV